MTREPGLRDTIARQIDAMIADGGQLIDVDEAMTSQLVALPPGIRSR